MQELERGIPAKQRFDEFLSQNELWMQIYKPFCYVPNERIRFGVQERTKRICRYCGKRMPETTFKKDAHTISNSLGNIFFFTNDECDECNTNFGSGIEQEFIKYVSVYRTLAAQYEGHPYFTTQTSAFRLDVDKETNKICIEILDTSKARIKSSETQTDLYADGGYVNFRYNDSTEYPYLIAEFHVNHIEFVFVVPGCQKDDFEIRDNILDDFLKLRKDNNKWRNLDMNHPQPIHMRFHASFPL